ncbi:MAG: hypothetical protein M1831_000231 [Alyxoria varia]|nr:MAG: hypothetical protein M1831_000231 [Alyxoria varia]
MLADKVYVVQCQKGDSKKSRSLERPKDEGLDAEDILSSSLTSLYPDDTCNQWGDPDTTIIYRSGKFGDINLALPDPAGEDNRKLFAHYLWNAGVYCAEAIAGGASNGDQNGLVGEEDIPAIVDSFWVKGEKVLELGAGIEAAPIWNFI